MFLHCTLAESPRKALVMGGAIFSANCVPGLACGHHTMTFSYDRTTDAWTREADMPNPMRDSACVKTVLGGRAVALVIGGMGTGTSVPDNNIVAFDLGRRTWSVVEAVPEAAPYLRSSLV